MLLSSTIQKIRKNVLVQKVNLFLVKKNKKSLNIELKPNEKFEALNIKKVLEIYDIKNVFPKILEVYKL